MDADEFLRSGAVSQTGSRLDPLKGDIEKLLAAGCKQVVVLQFLEKNGINISKAYLSKYVRSRPELAQFWKQKNRTVGKEEVKAATKEKPKTERLSSTNETPVIATIPDSNVENSVSRTTEENSESRVSSRKNPELDKFMKANSFSNRIKS